MYRNILVSYDISDNGLRDAVQKFLKNFDINAHALSTFSYTPRNRLSEETASADGYQDSVYWYYNCSDSVVNHLQWEIEEIVDHIRFSNITDEILLCSFEVIYKN